MLRPYQVDAINKIKLAYINGYKAPCLVAPCGAGKSIIVAEMAKKVTEKKGRVLFLVHRKELCEQIENTFCRWGVDMSLCNIAMVQTVSRKVEQLEEPKLIIVDENHHSLANSYKKIFERFKKIHRVGVTATPVRLSGQGLKDVNDVLIETVTCKWLIENKYLAPYKYYAPKVANLDGLKIKNGEFDTRDCEEILNKPAIYGDVIKHYRRLADGKKGICYAVSVAHSKAICEEFNNAGIVSAHIDGTTPKEARSDIVEKFRQGEVRILCNMDIISEGFDVPDCEVSILLRPTMSLTLYIQQSMRSMRFMEGKTAIILDHVGNAQRHGLPDMNRTWSLEGKKKKKKEKAEVSIITCDMCCCTWERSQGTICPECGYERPEEEKRRMAILENEELIEITEKEFVKTRKAMRQEFKKIQEARGYKKGWIWHQMQKLDSDHRELIRRLKID